MADDYKIINKKPLGKGAFGEVYLAQHRRKGFKVAIKQCMVTSDSQGVAAVREIKNFQHIAPHKHIVQMLDFSFEEGAFWLIMEYCDKGDLTDYMKKYAPSIDKQLKIMHQCASAVAHMHALSDPIIHRDIKPSNILFKTEGKSFVLKIADFGLSKIIDDSVSKLETFAGTYAFMAPELFSRKKYDHTVDIFALGLVYLAMINFKSTDEYVIPFSATYLENPEPPPKYIGHEMYEANLASTSQPVIVKTIATDSDKLKCVKKLIIDMVANKPGDRTPLKQVVKEIEKIAVGQTTAGMTGKMRPSQIFTSNLDITKTRFDSMASTISGGRSVDSGNGSGGDVSGSSTEGATSVVPARAVRGAESTEEEEEVPDIGYILMRKMIEDHVKKKERAKEKEKEEEKKRETLKGLDEALPLLQLLGLLKDSSSDNFSKGDRVVVDDDMQNAKVKQKHHGGWHDRMDRYLGKAGTVKEIRKGGMVEVQFEDGQRITWNASLLEQAHGDASRSPDGKITSTRFKMHDVVKVKVNAKEFERLQRRGHAGWKDRMTKVLGVQGVVHRIHFDGDVLVEFWNQDKFWVDPNALEVIDMSDKEIEAGDQVIILDDKIRVKQLQKGHGEWVDSMVKCLGRSGIVKKASTDRAVVEVEDTKYVWNLKCLQLILKSDDIIKMLLQRALADR